ncbi:AtpZ/AtpI family protein [Paenibacillus spongiae]|uniref:AtpZ/AtpI family protein n=1 Tax=Paenibacillus spongiae TaxID=2909671 RepID=A0ABY5S8F8_9BACL|nr:AtpZ/AtpI family protein [Paenibacillus spongiae]UVI29954.1 AtpZ/AtpI family protein [Paenibacillus spongiae]
MTQKSNGDNPWRTLAMVGALGFDVAFCTVLGLFLGKWLGGSPGWIIFGVLFGLAAGIITAILIVKKALEDTDG